MPRPGFPPTPASSAEIPGKEHGDTIDDFALPPAALHTASATSNPSHAQQQARQRRESNADGSGSPSGGAKRKRRSMNADMQIAAQASVSDAGVFSLPPPPSRSRKIIQVQPEDAAKSTSKSSGPSHGRKKSEGGKAGGSSSSAGTGGAAKSTAASRKTARKTAHSIIERRRRSKMNDEFETLKELVPAARGQNMHKLAILQAGIEYVRYLEDCIHGLKGAQQSGASSYKGTPMQLPADLQHAQMSRGSAIQDEDMDDDDEDDDDDDDEDDNEMEEDEDAPSEREPAMASTPRASRPGSMHQSVPNTPSPAIYPLNSHTSTSSYALSTGSPSPAILPSYGHAYPATGASSTLPSPALLPHDYKSPMGASLYGGGNGTPTSGSAVDYHALQAHAKKALAYHGEADQEVIATLTMMGTVRRQSREERDNMDGTRGMSVRDLLST